MHTTQPVSGLNFTTECITAMISHVLSFSAVQIYDISYIHLYSITTATNPFDPFALVFGGKRFCLSLLLAYRYIYIYVMSGHAFCSTCDVINVNVTRYS